MSSFLRLHSEVNVVRGYRKSVIIDFNRNRIEYIPNSMAEFVCLLTAEQEQCVSNTIDELPVSERATAQEYVDHLLNKEYGFLTDVPELFLIKNTAFDSASLISNTILDIASTIPRNLKSIVNDLNDLNCFHLEIRFFQYHSLSTIKSVLDEFSNSKLKSINLLVQYDEVFTSEVLNNLYGDCSKLTKLIFSSAPFEKIIQQNGYYVEYSKSNIINATHCGYVNLNYFTLNQEAFYHNKEYNSCLHGKLSIDTNGEIKNCPAMKVSFGNIANTSVKDVVINDQSFKKNWGIKKDDISVCQNCELRYICSDCRAFTVDATDIYSKPKHCSYDPLS